MGAMTLPPAASSSDASTTVMHTGARALRFLTRIPATLTMVALVLIVSASFGALTTPFHENPAWEWLAYGLPALSAGHWWTPITGTFFLTDPFAYPIVMPLFVAMAWFEYKRGWKAAAAYYWIGQLFATIGTSALLWGLSLTGWPWAVREAALYDVGPSGGLFALLAASVGLFVSPWRTRAWLALLAWVFIALLFWGDLADVAHVLGVLLILGVDRSLRLQRTSVREQRLLAFIGAITLGAVEIITLFLVTDGPFGHSSPATGSWLDIALDVVVILLIANGLRRGKRWAWVVALVLSLINIATLVLILAVIAITNGSTETVAIVGDPSLSLAISVLWIFALVYLLWVRGAFSAHRRSTIGIEPTPTVDEVKALLHTDGGGTLSWMTTWNGSLYARTSTGMVSYQKHAGVALALADPLGPASGRGTSVNEFIADAEAAGLIPCFFSSSDATKDQVPPGWRSLIVADDTIVDLAGLEFTGKRWSVVRTAINRAAREEVTFRMTRLSDEPWGIQQQIRAISEMWVGDKGLPEMGFTLGTLTEAADPEVRLALAVSAAGNVDGFLSWLPVCAPGGATHGWTLDLMRRREGGFGPVMEFLIGSSAKHFSEEGASILSLSGAPLTHDYPEDAGIIGTLSDKLAETLEPVYGFRSLHRFKQKFHPRYETMYLLFRDESDLARIGMALTKAFLPDATLRQFADAGLELVRGGGDDN